MNEFVVGLCVLAYLVGALQFGVILSACLGYGDPRMQDRVIPAQRMLLEIPA